MQRWGRIRTAPRSHHQHWNSLKGPGSKFARKLIRTMTATKSSIDCEASAITQIVNSGGHENIVCIFGHGLLQTRDHYFIDMAICDLTLRDYLGDYNRSLILSIGTTMHHRHPVFIAKEEAPELTTSQWQNVWVIMSHIASGVNFLHQHGLAHRDVKPENGMRR
jgi:serine/threonine protein kinase